MPRPITGILTSAVGPINHPVAEPLSKLFELLHQIIEQLDIQMSLKNNKTELKHAIIQLLSTNENARFALYLEKEEIDRKSVV